MTGQQRRVAELVADGLTDKQIAAVIEKSPQRVRQLIDQIATALRLDRSRNLRTQIAERRVAGFPLGA